MVSDDSPGQFSTPARSGGGERRRCESPAWLPIRFVGVMATLGTVLGFAGGIVERFFGDVLGRYGGLVDWMLDLFTHFRVQYCLCLGVCAVLLLPPRFFRFSACFALFAALNFVTISPFYERRNEHAAVPDKPSIRLMTFNVQRDNDDISGVAAVIRGSDADIVVLLETDHQWIEGLAPATDAYAHSVIDPTGGNFGIALYSRFPFLAAAVERIGLALRPSIIAEILTETGPIVVVATHPYPPMSATVHRLRNDQLKKLAARMTTLFRPRLLVGDLNITPWSRHFQEMLRISDLRNSADGFGVQPSWPDAPAPLRIPIDHVLHSPDIMIRDRRLGDNGGSDHFPVIVDFSIDVNK